MSKPAADSTPVKKPAAVLPAIGSTVNCRHPGFSEPYRGKVTRHWNAEWFAVETPNGVNIYTHHSYVKKYQPDLLGEVGEAEADRDPGKESAEDSGEKEPAIVPERYFALLRAWCEDHEHESAE